MDADPTPRAETAPGAVVCAIIGLVAVTDSALAGADEAPGEPIIGCPGGSMGVVDFATGAIIGLAVVTGCSAAGAAVVPAGRFIVDDCAGAIAGDIGLDIDSAVTLDPDCGDGAPPLSLRGLVPSAGPSCARAVA